MDDFLRPTAMAMILTPLAASEARKLFRVHREIGGINV